MSENLTQAKVALYCAGYTIYLVLPRTATAWNFEALWANDTLRASFSDSNSALLDR